MKIRPAESADRARIRAVARDSFRSSYSLSPQQIETILEEEFDDTALSEMLDDSNMIVLVADHTVDETEEVLGFITVSVETGATIHWLHVDPEARGDGIATALVDRVRDETGEAPITARVLDDAVEGGEFLEQFGLEQDGGEQFLVGGEEFAVNIFTEGNGTDDSNEPAVTVPESIMVDGEERFVDRDDSVPGREAPFFSVYSTKNEEEPYGYFCSPCGSTNVSADGLDRLECGNCGNEHRADEWDKAYL